MDDVIRRQSVLDAITASINQYGGRYTAEQLNMWGLFTQMVKEMPSAESESFEWCDTCKEYDQEAHCCHRYSKVIRKTVEEMQVVRCKDCKYAEYIDDVQTLWCTESGQGRTVAPYDFCSYGERREDG